MFGGVRAPSPELSIKTERSFNMAKRKRSSKQPEPTTPQRVAYGGALIRDFGNLPGLLEKFVHVTKQFDRPAFEKLIPTLEACFGRTNADPIKTDEQIDFPAGALFSLGAEGHSTAGKVVLVFKFVPLVALYPPQEFRGFFDVARNLEDI